MNIQHSELILNPDGSIYHLNLRPEHLANDIIFVGDQYRVDKVSQHFDTIEFTTQKLGRYLLGLQKSPQAWGCTGTDWSDGKKLVHMPGSTETGDLGSLDENTDEGVSEFYVLQSNRPFPTVFAKALMDEVPLGRTDLSLLAEYLRDTPKKDVHVMRFDVEFTRPISDSG